MTTEVIKLSPTLTLTKRTVNGFVLHTLVKQ